MKDTIYKLIKDYDRKIKDCDILITDYEEVLKKQKKTGASHNELFFLKKDIAIKEAQKQAYITAKHDIDSLLDITQENLIQTLLNWRGIEKEEDVCDGCGGSGKRVYGSASTWKGGISGQVITTDVCDKCWGSGDKSHKGADLRFLYNKIKTLSKK